jgi:hypothetical protein
MSKLQTVWERMGGRVGLTVSLAGFVVIFLGWNGAAGYDRVPSQFPYLFGAIGGLGMVFLGSAMVVVEANRQQRAELKDAIESLRTVIGEPVAPVNGHAPATPKGVVVAGRSAYHRPDCRLLDGRDTDTKLVSARDAVESGLNPCRICQPAALVT